MNIRIHRGGDRHGKRASGRSAGELAFVLLTLLAPISAKAAPTGSGEFEVCQACHGAKGEGAESLNAPRLAGQNSDYIVRQLNDFRDGRRGAAVEDVTGQQMAPMAKLLPDEAAIARVAAYIASLPEARLTTSVKGDVNAGRTAFSQCSACHGARGEGGGSLNAPRLAGMSDWYLLKQMESFRKGLRGGEGASSQAATMRAIAVAIPSEETERNLVAYIDTLRFTAKPASKLKADRAQ